MAELLVGVKDTVGVDVYSNAKLTKRGMVWTVSPDGWGWGTEELGNAMVRVFKFPGVDPAQFINLTSWEAATVPGINPIMLNNTIQMRQNKLNLDDPNLPQEVKDYIADDTRKQPFFVWKGPLSAFTTLTLKLSAIADPAIIGPDPVAF